MARTPIADTVGECWLAAQAGRHVSPYIAARRMDHADTMRFGRHGAVMPVSIDAEKIDVAEGLSAPFDAELAELARIACDAELEGLAGLLAEGLDQRTIALRLSVSQPTVSRAIQRIRRRLNQN